MNTFVVVLDLDEGDHNALGDEAAAKLEKLAGICRGIGLRVGRISLTDDDGVEYGIAYLRANS